MEEIAAENDNSDWSFDKEGDTMTKDSGRAV